MYTVSLKKCEISDIILTEENIKIDKVYQCIKDTNFFLNVMMSMMLCVE